MFWHNIGELLSGYWVTFGYGLLNTLILAVVGTVVGLVIGIFAGQVRNIKCRADDPWFAKLPKKCAVWLAVAYVTFFRGTPMMVQAIILYLAGPYIGLKWLNWTIAGDIGRVFNGQMYCGLIVICINTGAYMTEIIKSGMNGVDPGQAEAARSLGLSNTKTLWGITLPQAIRNCLPTIGNEYIVNIKDSSVLSIASVTELYASVSIATNRNYFMIEGYFIIAIVYLLLTVLADLLLRLLALKLKFPDRKSLFAFHHRTQIKSSPAPASSQYQQPVLNFGNDCDTAASDRKGAPDNGD